jgi:hypothetical protein
MNGPLWGCSSSAGCIEYGCFSGQCLPQKKTQCCGNGVCDGGEDFTSCAKDCKPTCYDGLKNQGEDNIDCGGPCPACGWGDVNYLRKIGYIRGLWYSIAANYTDAIKSYNSKEGGDNLMTLATESYSDVDALQGILSKTEPSKRYAPLAVHLNGTLNLHMEAINNMILFLKLHDDKYRLDSNRLFSDALVSDREFVTEYNNLVDEANTLQARCSNFAKDDGEESVDCGGACRTPCEALINVTKYVMVRSEGGPVHLLMNVSSPAIDYPPSQVLEGFKVRPIPDDKEKSDEGNLYYIYDFNMPEFGVREFEITQTVRMMKVPYPVESGGGYFNPIYLMENNNSQMTEDICFRAGMLKSKTRNMSETASDIYDWMRESIDYESNLGEFGAEYCYANQRGACDEQADLFVSMARCDGVPSRRVTGNLLNVSQLNGHAWAEYYDGKNWIYLDPSVKNHKQAFTADKKHLAACVGEGAYDCGVEYSFTYKGKKPKLEVKEQVYLS